ncbi:MAG: methyltransferase [Candidatus Pacearchaeota archaeon]|jgi:HemK-related putative methylase
MTIVYEASDDSYFLAEIVDKYLVNLKKEKIKDIKVLDLGTGSGIQSKNCIKLGVKKQNILAIDINSSALDRVKELKVKTLKSDLFEAFKRKGSVRRNLVLPQKYNLIIFNPPYLPEDKYDKLKDTTGGKKGDETIVRFIGKLNKHLSEMGVCFLLTSSFTPEKAWKAEAKKQKLEVKRLARRKLFFEELYVWEIKLSNS